MFILNYSDTEKQQYDYFGIYKLVILCSTLKMWVASVIAVCVVWVICLFAGLLFRSPDKTLPLNYILQMDAFSKRAGEGTQKDKKVKQQQQFIIKIQI